MRSNHVEDRRRSPGRNRSTDFPTAGSAAFSSGPHQRSTSRRMRMSCSNPGPPDDGRWARTEAAGTRAEEDAGKSNATCIARDVDVTVAEEVEEDPAGTRTDGGNGVVLSPSVAGLGAEVCVAVTEGNRCPQTVHLLWPKQHCRQNV
uniref:Uncharacterized protein n=1 Tax=Anopheles atroparvus TaxID=41427 RepID=A0A182IW04_ANOAO